MRQKKVSGEGAMMHRLGALVQSKRPGHRAGSKAHGMGPLIGTLFSCPFLHRLCKIDLQGCGGEDIFRGSSLAPFRAPNGNRSGRFLSMVRFDLLHLAATRTWGLRWPSGPEL
jgi:hypothetical protein